MKWVGLGPIWVAGELAHTLTIEAQQRGGRKKQLYIPHEIDGDYSYLGSSHIP